MTGHIALGAPGALREYMIANLDLYSKAPANQFAAKLATGAGDYDDLQNWSYFVMDNWQTGVGQKDAEAGGFLYAECDTRYPNQLFLSRHLHLEMQDSAGVHALDATEVTAEETIGTAQTKRRWAVQIGGGTGRTLDTVWVYLKNDGASYTVRLSGDTTSAPGTSLQTGSITTSTTTPGYQWYKCALTLTNITSSLYWVSLEPTTTGVVPKVGAVHATPTLVKYYDGAAWQTTTDYFGILLNAGAYGNDGTVPLDNSQVVEFNDTLYVIGLDNAGSYKRTGSAPGWSAAAGSVTGTPLLPLGDLLYIARDQATTSASNMDTGETITNFSVPDGANGEVAHLAVWGGYLWAAYAHNVFYTSTPGADGAQWTGPVAVSHDGEIVTGLAGLGDYMYVSTEKELVYVGFGDQVLGVSVWGSPSAANGANMLHWQGALYIPMQESMIRYDAQSMLPMGPDLGEGLPGDKQGNIVAVASTNNWLFIAVDPRSTSDRATVWAYIGQGWHSIAVLPPGMQTSSLYYRRSNQRLYIGCDTGHVFSLYVPDVAKVVDATEPEFAPVGWLETDWFYGGLRDVNKDFESVYILGEDITANQYIDVYWQDDASTNWEYLGRVTSNQQELRWSDYGTRPNTEQLKLGLLLRTTDQSESPFLRAVRLKDHPIVSDWYRWSFPILVSNNQQQVDGSIATENAQQKRDHLDTLITQVPPFIFRDMDGKLYEVKVMGCPIQHDTVEWYDGELVFDSLYNLTIEQIRNGEYSA